MVGLALKDVDIEKKRNKITFDSDSENEGTKEKEIKKRKVIDDVSIYDVNT